MEISNIVVVGSGTMGRQIAMSCALGGFRTILQDISQDALAAARAELEGWVQGRVAKEKLSEQEGQQALARLTQASHLADAVAHADLVIEAAVEKLDIKRQIFAQLGKHAAEHAIFATNSSTLASSHVAEASGRPAQVCNMHFFNPALVMKCVEIVRHERTSDQTIEAVTEVARVLGKEPVLVSKEIPGFIANRMMGAMHREALDLSHAGIATMRDIDTAAKTALGHPMGPFELMDLVGLDVVDFIAQATFAETGDEADKPHPLIVERVQAGKLGRKSGEGFYSYKA